MLASMAAAFGPTGAVVNKFCQMLSWRLLRVAASPERRSHFPPSDLPFALSNTP